MCDLSLASVTLLVSDYGDHCLSSGTSATHASTWSGLGCVPMYPCKPNPRQFCSPAAAKLASHRLMGGLDCRSSSASPISWVGEIHRCRKGRHSPPSGATVVAIDGRLSLAVMHLCSIVSFRDESVLSVSRSSIIISNLRLQGFFVHSIENAETDIADLVVWITSCAYVRFAV